MGLSYIILAKFGKAKERKKKVFFLSKCKDGAPLVIVSIKRTNIKIII